LPRIDPAGILRSEVAVGLVNALNRIVVPKDGVNDLQRAGYEAYYLTFNHRASRTGFWIRYTQDRRGPSASGSEAALWFHCFRGAAPEKSFGIKQSFDLGVLGSGPDAHIRIGDAFFAEGQARGEAAAGGHRVSWDLRFDPAPTAIWYAPEPLRMLGLAKTPAVISNPDIKYSGTLVIDGERMELANEPGSQAHNWGGKRSHAMWGHCNAFDAGAGCDVEGAGAFLGRRAGRPGRLVTTMFIRYRGEDYLCNALHAFLGTRAELAFPTWKFRCEAKGTQFSGNFSARPEILRQVAYEDPDGEKAWCCNTEIGDLIVDVSRGGKAVETLRATGTAHLEFISRSKRPDVQVTVE
jgi:hypothetical protein